jgi:hypothetical protein
MLLAMAEQAGDKSKQCLGRAECLVMVHWRHSGDLSESVSLPIAEVRLGVLGASRRPNSPSGRKVRHGVMVKARSPIAAGSMIQGFLCRQNVALLASPNLQSRLLDGAGE